MSQLEKVIKLHEEQVASKYTCVDKKSKYAKDIDDHMDSWQWYNGRKYGYDWCTVYFDWIFIHAIGVEEARKALNRPKKSMGAGVRYSREYLKSIGRVGNVPKVGCAVYFGSLPYPHHIGFVYKVTDSYIYTYEGNCYISNGVSGVKARCYSRSYPDILDYGYPLYEEGPEPDPKEMDGYKVGNTYEVVCDEPLMIRKGPGSSFDKIGKLDKGDRITCTGLRHDQDGNTWLEHDQGWSCGLYQGERYMTDPPKVEWVKRDGKWYYFDQNSQMVKSDWVKWQDRWYYLGDDGAMLTGWQLINEKWYYFYTGNDGHMAKSEWIQNYWIDKDGTQTYPYKGKWHEDDKGWWYEDSSGWYPRGQAQRINMHDYRFDSKGYLIEE